MSKHLRRFHIPQGDYHVGDSVTLTEEEAEHIVKTLRMESGNEIILFDGQRVFLAKLTKAAKSEVVAKLVSEEQSHPVPGPRIDLMMALIRPANFELVIQKTVELGVNRLLPIKTERSQLKLEAAVAKSGRWHRLIVEACKQSEQVQIPELATPQGLPDILDSFESYDQVFILEVPRADRADIPDLVNVLQSNEGASKVGILVGPEGGFTDAEVEMALARGAILAALPFQVLKAETAGIVAVALIKALSRPHSAA